MAGKGCLRRWYLTCIVQNCLQCTEKSIYTVLAGEGDRGGYVQGISPCHPYPTTHIPSYPTNPNHYNFSSNPIPIITISRQILFQSLQFLVKSYLNHYNFLSNPIPIMTISRQILFQSLKFLVKSYPNHYKFSSNPILIITIYGQIISQSQ